MLARSSGFSKLISIRQFVLPAWPDVAETVPVGLNPLRQQHYAPKLEEGCRSLTPPPPLSPQVANDLLRAAPPLFCYSPPSVRPPPPPPPDGDDLLISPPPPLPHSTLFRSYLVHALLVPPQRQYTLTVRNCGMRSFGRDVCPTSQSARGDLRAGGRA